jgi:septal ring factor EnvC (AmiA/AmiB activator)
MLTKNFKYVLFALFISSWLFCFDAMAGDAAKKTKELTGLQIKIKKITRKINDLKVKKNSLLAELKKLDVQYGESAVILSQLELQVNKLNAVLKKNRRQMQLTQQQIDSQKHELAIQIKAAHGMGKNEKLKLMLNQQDPSLSGRMISYYDYFNKARIKKIALIDKDLQVLRDLEQQRLVETASLEGKVKERKLERSVLSNTKKQRKALLVKINKQFFSKKRQLSRFKASEKRLKSLISSLQQTMDDFPFDDGVVKEFAKLKGKLPWPLKGTLVKKFGAKRSDSKWNGVLIKAKEGANIRVVTRGRVVYADWLRGYGLLTIIDHGSGYMTLYAFNQSLYKTVGEWVDAGDVIATVGKSGGQENAGLYFGVRKKGKPVNPVKWCRKIRAGKIR